MVEIIPRKTEETPSWQRLSLYVLFLVMVLFVVTYGFLFYNYSQLEGRMRELEAKLTEIRDPIVSEMEKETVEYKERLDSFAPFLESHIMMSRFFNFIEDNTHPQVVFSDLNVSANISRVGLSGKTDNFLSLGQQLDTLDNHPIVTSLILSQISLNEKGGIDFNLNMVLDRSIFQY